MTCAASPGAPTGARSRRRAQPTAPSAFGTPRRARPACRRSFWVATTSSRAGAAPRRFASRSTPGRLLRASTGGVVSPLPPGAYSADASRAAVAGRGLQIQDDTGRVLHRLSLSDRDSDEGGKSVAFSPDGRTLAVGFLGRQEFRS